MPTAIRKCPCCPWGAPGGILGDIGHGITPEVGSAPGGVLGSPISLGGSLMLFNETFEGWRLSDFGVVDGNFV